MIKNTDLPSLKKLAKSFLHLPVVETDYSPSIVQHPFTDTAMITVKTDGGYTHVDITKDNNALNAWLNRFENYIDDCKTALNLYTMINKPYIFAFLKYAKPYLNLLDFSEILGDAWTRVEYSNLNQDLTPSDLVTYFKQSDKKSIMD